MLFGKNLPLLTVFLYLLIIFAQTFIYLTIWFINLSLHYLHCFA